MNQLRTAVLPLIFALFVLAHSAFVFAQHESVTVDWKAELAKAKAGIEKNRKSAFWHSQAGIAYDGLGDFENAIREVRMACTLDSSNPNHYYTLYALYKKKGMHSEQRQAILDALERDPNNPLGRFEFGSVLEDDKHWENALQEYREAELLLADVKGSSYVDPRGNFDDVDGVRALVDKAIARVAKFEKTGHKQQ